jgi:hypothetical protein
MTFFKKVKTFADGAADVLGTIASIPVLGSLFKGFMGHVEKEVGKILGGNTETAQKDTYDEDLYGAAEHATGLSPEETIALQEFEARLRNESPDKAAAFVLFVAKKIKSFEREVKEVQQPAKGQPGPRVERSYKNIDAGIEQAVYFFKDILERDTYEKKMVFLEGKNVFSLIRTEPLLVRKIREAARKTEDYFQSGNLGKKAESVKKNLAENSADLDQKLTSFKDRAKAWRDAAPRRR